MRLSNRSIQRTILSAAFIALAAGLAAPVFAQDSSGNALLNGSFRFRYIAITNENATTGQVTAVSAEEGVITFQGNGTYTITAGSQWNDPLVSNGAFQSIPANFTGSYAISPAGVGVLESTDPDENLPGGDINITYSQGVITGSSTEQVENDFFVAIAVGTVPTNASFNSTYWVGALDYAAGSDIDVKNALFQISPNGAGSLGALTIQGQANSVSGTSLTQTVTGATYNFASDGNAQFSIPAPTPTVTASAILVSGSRTVYVSGDGNFLLGWTPNGYDIIFGVKAAPASTPASDSMYTGMYYQSGMGDQPTVGGTENCGPYSFWGSLNADGMENEVMHQRLLWACSGYSGEYGPVPYDLETWDVTEINPSDVTPTLPNGGAYDAPLGDLLYGGSTYGFGDVGGGCVPSGTTAACAFVAISNSSGSFGLTIGVHTPNYTSPGGVYLSPIGVVNAASWDPVTASVAPGELLTLFGSFGSSLPVLISTGGQPFPTQLGPVQVFINGQAAPIYYISPTQISVIAPWELATLTPYDESPTTGSVTAEVQVQNGTTLSNEVSINLLTDANSGIYTATENGIGRAQALHADYSLVCDPAVEPTCTGSPAQPGETIIMALAGMGLVNPQIGDGVVPPASPLSYVEDYIAGNFNVYFQDYDNDIGYAPANAIPFLYPNYASLYQMNVTVPTSVGPGDDIYVEIITPYADNVQVSVPVAGNANSAVRSALSRTASTSRSSLNPRPASLRKGPQTPVQRPAAARTQFHKRSRSVSAVPGPVTPSAGTPQQ